MNDALGTIFGFLGGTIVSCTEGYRVLEHPNPKRVYPRLSEAKWFLALRWCEQLSTPAGILNYEGHLAFYNAASLRVGDEQFVPHYYRTLVFEQCLKRPLGEAFLYPCPWNVGRQTLRVIGIEIDPRFGRIALVQSIGSHPASTQTASSRL
ncbi:MAG: hypothetical protein ACPGVO_21360 [Spirulinaceae cyanobacterium]